MSIDPRAQWPEFYANPAVADLAEVCRWTVSTTKPSEQFPNKAPLDMRCLLDGGTSKRGLSLPPGTARGAFRNDETCLVTLRELTERFPSANNVAYYLNTQLDGYVVLDIEKTCPPAEAGRLLSMPGALFTETSMSGKGYHLLLPLPDNFWEWPKAARKRVLKHPQGWWEILMEHWVTFTRNVVPEARLEALRAAYDGPPVTWEDVWAEVASEARESPSASLELGLGDKPEIPYEAKIVASVCARPIEKTPADFANDLSRWEFSTLGVLWHRLSAHVGYYAYRVPAGTYSDLALVWLLYACAVKVLPHRDKHDGERGGMPYLWDRAAALIGFRLAEPDE